MGKFLKIITILFLAMADCNVKELNMRLAECAKRKKLDEAETLYNHVVSVSKANRFTDAIMVNVYVQCGHVEKAHDLLQKIRSTNNGFVPGVVTCTSLLKGFCSNGIEQYIILHAALRY